MQAIAADVGGGRTAKQAHQRWTRRGVGMTNRKTGRWSAEEDHTLVQVQPTATGSCLCLAFTAQLQLRERCTANRSALFLAVRRCQHIPVLCIKSMQPRLDSQTERCARAGSIQKSTRSLLSSRLPGRLQGVELHGTRWSLVAQSVEGRTDVQCRERYTEHLDPRLVKGKFTAGAMKFCCIAKAALCCAGLLGGQRWGPRYWSW